MLKNIFELLIMIFIVKKVQNFNINDVKQKGVDMLGYSFLRGNNQKKKRKKILILIKMKIIIKRIMN